MRPSPSVPSSVLFLLSSGDLGEPRGIMGVNSHTVKEMVGSDVTGFTQDSQLQAARWSWSAACPEDTSVPTHTALAERLPFAPAVCPPSSIVRKNQP